MTISPRILLWDLECFHLNWGADLGATLCMGYKWLGDSKVHLVTLRDHYHKNYLDDSALVHLCASILSEADMWVTYNGLKFDVPWLQTRLLIHGQEPLTPVAHKDLYPTIKYKFKFSRKSLFNVQQALNLDESKTPVRLEQWLHALVGERSAWAEIEDHCRKDVLVLEQAYKRVLPFMQSHPRLTSYGVCNKCSGTLLKNKIYHTSNKHPKITLQCQKCRGYETRIATQADLKNFRSGDALA